MPNLRLIDSPRRWSTVPSPEAATVTVCAWGREVARCADAIFHRHVLLQLPAELVRKNARRGVGAVPGRKRDDQRDESAALGGCRRGLEQRCGERRSP